MNDVENSMKDGLSFEKNLIWEWVLIGLGLLIGFWLAIAYFNISYLLGAISTLVMLIVFYKIFKEQTRNVRFYQDFIKEYNEVKNKAKIKTATSCLVSSSNVVLRASQRGGSAKIISHLQGPHAKVDIVGSQEYHVIRGENSIYFASNRSDLLNNIRKLRINYQQELGAFVKSNDTDKMEKVSIIRELVSVLLDLENFTSVKAQRGRGKERYFRQRLSFQMEHKYNEDLTKLFYLLYQLKINEDKIVSVEY